jgi:hypothetical protein
MALRVAGRGVRAAAVRSLSFLPGGGDGGEDCLLVFGGQGEGEPDMLTLLPLAPQPDGDGGGRQVPWFGSIKGLCTVRCRLRCPPARPWPPTHAIACGNAPRRGVLKGSSTVYCHHSPLLLPPPPRGRCRLRVRCHLPTRPWG